MKFLYVVTGTSIREAGQPCNRCHKLSDPCRADSSASSFVFRMDLSVSSMSTPWTSFLLAVNGLIDVELMFLVQHVE